MHSTTKAESRGKALAVAACLAVFGLLWPICASAQVPEDEESPEAIVEKEIAEENRLFSEALAALEAEPQSVKNDRMIRMLKLLELNADDRVLNPLYATAYAGLADTNGWEEFVEPDDARVQESDILISHARRMLLDKLRGAETTGAVLNRVNQVHDLVHNSYAYALELESAAALGGASSYSSAEKAFHAWVSERQRSGKSVYSAWAR